MNTPTPAHDGSDLSKQQSGILLVSIMMVALCGIAYELIIGTVASYLLGNSVFQFSLTIGLFMFAMGIGSYLSKLLGDQLIRNFIVVEIAIAVVGGICSMCLFLAFAKINPMFSGVMYGFILVIGALVGLEIPILTSILSKRSSVKDSIAHVLSLDYVGALIGSLAFPLLLLPQLGLIRSSFAVGLINILTALVTLLFFRHSLPHAKRWIAVCTLILAALIGFTIYGSFLSSYAEKHLYFDQIIRTEQTPYQRIVVTKSSMTGDHRLYIDGHIQFSERDEYRYHEALVHPTMALPGPRKNVLILGGGDGLAAREVLKYADVERIDLVDIDPVITEFSRQFAVLADLNAGSLDDPRVTVYNQDAFTFINQPGIAYDRVLIDMPDPHNEVLNKLYSREFYTMIRRRSTPDTVIASQSSSPFFTHRTYWCIEETLAAVFSNTWSYQITVPAFGVWGFHLASERDLAAAMPSVDFDVPTQFMDQPVLMAAAVFPADIAEIDSPVNTIMEPKLYQLYLQDLKH